MQILENSRNKLDMLIYLEGYYKNHERKEENLLFGKYSREFLLGILPVG